MDETLQKDRLYSQTIFWRTDLAEEHLEKLNIKYNKYPGNKSIT